MGFSFKNRKISGPPGMLESFGFTPPDWLAYGPLPISICMALSYFPFAFLLFSSALSKIDIQSKISFKKLVSYVDTYFKALVIIPI